MRTIRAAGFAPVAPPLREGTDYVLRATDYRGILMHVVVDARTGAIRDAVRIVPGPGRYGQYFGGQPFEGDGVEAAGLPPPDAGTERLPARPAPIARPAVAPAVVVTPPPLPRPRPAELASRNASGEPVTPPKPLPQPAAASEPPKTDTANGGHGVPGGATGGAAAPASPAASAESKPQINSEVVTVPPPAPAKPGKVPLPLTIDN